MRKRVKNKDRLAASTYPKNEQHAGLTSCSLLQALFSLLIDLHPHVQLESQGSTIQAPEDIFPGRLF